MTSSSTHSRFLPDLFEDLADGAASAATNSDEQRLARRAAVAVALVPVLVLAALTLVIADWLAADTGFGLVTACIAWLVFEMHRYQRAISRQDTAGALGAGDLSLADPHGPCTPADQQPRVQENL